MPIDPQELAQMLGAKLAGEVPDVGGGPFGMARLAHILHQSLTPSQGERPGRPTNANWVARCKVPMSEATFRKLTYLAENMSTPERKVSPMQLAAQLLEEAVGQVEVKKPANLGEEMVQGSKVINSASARKDKPRGQGGKAGGRKKA